MSGPLPPSPSDKQTAREAKRTERREAAARSLWQQGKSTGNAELDDAARRKIWEDWAANAKQHADVGRTIFIAKINLGHTSAGYLGGNPRESGVADPAWIVQAIESAGWLLSETGYVYQTIRERSHMLTDSAQIEGNIIGIYTFRRPRAGQQGPTEERGV
jgi:hypothetical protein